MVAALVEFESRVRPAPSGYGSAMATVVECITVAKSNGDAMAPAAQVAANVWWRRYFRQFYEDNAGDLAVGAQPIQRVAATGAMSFEHIQNVKSSTRDFDSVAKSWVDAAFAQMPVLPKPDAERDFGFESGKLRIHNFFSGMFAVVVLDTKPTTLEEYNKAVGDAFETLSPAFQGVSILGQDGIESVRKAIADDPSLSGATLGPHHYVYQCRWFSGYPVDATHKVKAGTPTPKPRSGSPYIRTATGELNLRLPVTMRCQIGDDALKEGDKPIAVAGNSDFSSIGVLLGGVAVNVKCALGARGAIVGFKDRSSAAISFDSSGNPAGFDETAGSFGERTLFVPPNCNSGNGASDKWNAKLKDANIAIRAASMPKEAEADEFNADAFEVTAPPEEEDKAAVSIDKDDEDEAGDFNPAGFEANALPIQEDERAALIKAERDEAPSIGAAAGEFKLDAVDLPVDEPPAGQGNDVEQLTPDPDEVEEGGDFDPASFASNF